MRLGCKNGSRKTATALCGCTSRRLGSRKKRRTTRKVTSPLADLLLRLAAGFPVGQSLCQVPLHVSARMAEQQLYMLIGTLAKRSEDDDEPEPDPRQYHREWAKQNRIPDWLEPELR